MRTPITCQPRSVAAVLATEKGASSMRCHCITRVSSTDTASSRAGVLGRVQRVTRASVLQAYIDIGLDLCATRTHLHTPLCCDGMIATFTYHQCTIANTTHKLRWHACTRGHMYACAPVVFPHAFTRWCGCAMGTSTGPKQAVAHVIMPVMNVGNPSKWIAAKMGVQGCREDCVLEAHGPYW